MEEMILVYITHPSREKAEKLMRYLLDKRIVACANIFPVESMYWWEGEISYETEYITIIKTVEENFISLKHAVEELHLYQIPCIIKLPVMANQLFVQWIRGEIRS